MENKRRLTTSLVILILLVGAIAVAVFFFRFYKFDYREANKDNSLVSEDVSNKNFYSEKLINNNPNRAFLNGSLNATKPLKLLFFGDMMLDRHVGEKLTNKKIGYLLDDLAGEEKEFFVGYDIIGANLEGAVTNEGDHYPPHNLYDFAFAPERIAELKDYGFNYFALANNHFSDQGERGIIETRKNLSEQGFYFSGAADARIDENTRQDLEIAGRKIAMISLSMVYNNFDLSQAKDLVEKAAVETDFTIINLHWGNEYQHLFNRYQQNVGRALISAGADIIIGHHPHVVQGIEIYQGKPILYSLGNFIFDQYFSAATQESLAVDLTIDDDELTISFLPLRSSGSIPRLMNEGEKNNFFRKFATWSELSAETKELLLDGRLVLPRTTISSEE